MTKNSHARPNTFRVSEKLLLILLSGHRGNSTHIPVSPASPSLQGCNSQGSHSSAHQSCPLLVERCHCRELPLLAGTKISALTHPDVSHKDKLKENAPRPSKRRKLTLFLTSLC